MAETTSGEKRSLWDRLVERCESWQYRRTYGRNADHSRAFAAADAQRRGKTPGQERRAEALTTSAPSLSVSTTLTGPSGPSEDA